MSSSRRSPDPMILLREVDPRGGHRLHLVFSDGRHGTHDFSAISDRKGEMIAPLADPGFFARAFVDDGALSWPNGYDWDPCSLYATMLDAGELSITLAAE